MKPISNIASSSSGGGHSIEDNNGIELTQRDTLQIKGSLIAEDDSANSKTIITDGMEEIDWEDWLELTDEEKSAIPKAVITNVPGLDSKLNVQFLKELWTNPSPSAAFAAQTITLNSDDYDFLLIIYKSTIGDGNNNFGADIIPKGKGTYIERSFNTGSVVIYTRQFQRTSDTQYSVKAGYNNTTTENNAIVPITIYGFKTSVDVDITAYMADLSTDAKNVYLESGTSLEDAAVKVTEVTITNKSISGNNKLNLGSLTSNLPSDSTLVSFNIKSGIDTDIICYSVGGVLYGRNFNSSSITISSAKIDVFYI